MQTETEKFCKNHTDRAAKRHCYFCGDPICAACQKHAYHHIFCSPKCIRQFRLQLFFKTFNNFSRRLKSLLKGPTLRFLFDFGLFIVLVLCLLTIYRLRNYTKDLQLLLTSLRDQSSQQSDKFSVQDNLIRSKLDLYKYNVDFERWLREFVEDLIPDTDPFLKDVMDVATERIRFADISEKYITEVYNDLIGG